MLSYSICDRELICHGNSTADWVGKTDEFGGRRTAWLWLIITLSLILALFPIVFIQLLEGLVHLLGYLLGVAYGRLELCPHGANILLSKSTPRLSYVGLRYDWPLVVPPRDCLVWKHTGKWPVLQHISHHVWFFDFIHYFEMWPSLSHFLELFFL